MIFLLSVSANAQYIVDTGPGQSGGGYALINWQDSYTQYLAVEFSIDNTYILSSIVGWMTHWDWSDQGRPINVDFVIYGDGGNIPDVNNELFHQVASIPADIMPQWHGISNLDWTLTSGTYWLAFEVRQPQFSEEDDAPLSMPINAPNPLQGALYGEGFGYVPKSLSIGARIQATVVPEPVSSTLFIAGGATLGFRRFRNKFKK